MSVYVYAMKYYSVIKNEFAFVTECINSEGTKWNKSEKDKYPMMLLVCRMQKARQMNEQQKQTHEHTELVVARGKGNCGK